MINGLAIWHYPHRAMIENIAYFKEQGYDAVSLLGKEFVTELAQGNGKQIADAIKSAGVTLTVHHAVPRSHGQEDETEFYKGIDFIADWQAKYGLIAVLSFDVFVGVRDDITPYVNYVLEKVNDTRIALEDFGLIAAERAQVAHLQGNPNFGCLVDIGHSLVRMNGKSPDKRVTLSPNEYEGKADGIPVCGDYLRAFQNAQFPIFEMHLHNNDGLRDLHLFLEDGVLDINEVAKAMKAFGYDGIVTIESAPGYAFDCHGADADEGIAKTFAYWKDCYQKA